MSTTLDEANRQIALRDAKIARYRNALYMASAMFEQAKHWRWWAPTQKIALAQVVAEIDRVIGQ